MKMMISTIFFVLMSLMATVWGGSGLIYKRGLPAHYGQYEFQGYNNHIDDYSHHYSHYSHSLPAYSTVSLVMANGHKPVSYSGFTNHGRGHHDPGYSVQYRSDGFPTVGKGHHHYYH